MQIHIWKLSNNSQVQGNRSMSRITYSNLYDNTETKIITENIYLGEHIQCL